MPYNPLALILIISGGYMLVKLRAFFILHPIKTVKKITNALKSKKNFNSLSLALAGTLGVGNVFGVCFGIIVGGKGSVFWLLLSTVFAAVLKYSEVVLSFDNMQFNKFGAAGSIIHVLHHTFTRYGRRLAYAYAFFCVLTSLSLGSALQSGTVGEICSALFNTHPYVVAAIFTVIAFISILGGVKIIERITALAIPLSTIVYIIITGSIIVGGINRIGVITLEIICDAFSIRAGVGGIIGFLCSDSLREGFSRGVLSNEAGCGTSSMAHSRSAVLSPSLAGLFGIFEVFFDTGVLCMLTAYAVLLTVPNPGIFKTGMSLIAYTVRATLGRSFSLLLFATVVIFAYATVVCWYYYGQTAFLYLTNGKARTVFLFLFSTFVFLGPLLKSSALVFFTDFFLLCLAVLTLSVVIKKSDRIKHLSERGGLIKPRYDIRENVCAKARVRQGRQAFLPPRSPKGRE